MMRRNFGKKMVLTFLGAVVLSLTACGEKTETETVKNEIAAEKSDKKDKKDKKDKDNKETVFPIQMTDFGNVGNNPNNLHLGYDLAGMAFDEDYIYFCANQNLYKATHSGTDVVLLDAVSCDSLNRHGDYLYYVQYGGWGKRCNLITGETEDILVREVSKDLHTVGKSVYKAFHRVYDFFIVDDYLFFEDVEGYEGTSQGGSQVLSVLDLTTMTEYKGIKEGGAAAYSTDGEYVYTLGGELNRIALSDIKEGATMEHVIKHRGMDYEDSMLIGTDGICCVDEEDDRFAYYCYQFGDIVDADSIFGKRTELFDISALGYTEYDLLDGSSFLVDDTLFNLVYNRTLYYMKDMDLKNPGKVEGFEAMDAIGCYENKLYMVDQWGERLTIVDTEGTVEQITLELPVSESAE